MNNPHQTLKDIKRLLSAFPPVSGDPALVLHNYLNAVGDFAPELVTDAVDLVLKGELPNHDGRFVPTAPMMATACRLAAERLARANYLDGIRRPALPKPDIVHTPDSQERVRQMTQHAVETIGAVNLHHSEEAINASKARWEKVNDYFAPPQDDASLTERLNLRRDPRGFDIGSPESEENAA